MLKTLLDKPASWMDATGPEAAYVINTRGGLSRNLMDLPFPPRCSEDELLTAEQRIIDALSQAGYFDSGQYYPLTDLEPHEITMLEERQLISERVSQRSVGRGVFVSDDQAFSIMVNDSDHLRFQLLVSGLQLDQAWKRLNEVDTKLEKTLDFAFDERLGYLTASLAAVGTGLRMTVLVHLPGLLMTNQIRELERELESNRHEMHAYAGNLGEPRGDLYQITNKVTLGRSEEEIAYHLRQQVRRAIDMEKEARNTVLDESVRGLEDRVGRALGIARGAHLLELDEALGVLSSLRLGLATGLLDGYSYRQLNEMLIQSQRGHIEMCRGSAADELELSKERAERFRMSFS